MRWTWKYGDRPMISGCSPHPPAFSIPCCRRSPRVPALGESVSWDHCGHTPWCCGCNAVADQSWRACRLSLGLAKAGECRCELGTSARPDISTVHDLRPCNSRPMSVLHGRRGQMDWGESIVATERSIHRLAHIQSRRGHFRHKLLDKFDRALPLDDSC